MKVTTAIVRKRTDADQHRLSGSLHASEGEEPPAFHDLLPKSARKKKDDKKKDRNDQEGL
jgi:hypothetical protein